MATEQVIICDFDAHHAGTKTRGFEDEGFRAAVAFSFEGDEYLIDLSKENYEALKAALEPFRLAAQKVEKQAGPRAYDSYTDEQKAYAKAAKQWAMDPANGVPSAIRPKAETGVLGKNVREAYEKATGKMWPESEPEKAEADGATPPKSAPRARAGSKG